ncbi:MAG: DUF4836 family protein [Prevotellaceae bacterium]|jgi:hypothetical protein|nr:DUF4836 family protein [Prevotellaceae bacterium]
MKTVKFSIIIALCSVIICGCSKQSVTDSHLVAVPDNAAIVLSINAKQIIEKAGLNNPDQYKVYSLLQQEIEQAPAEEAKIIKDVLKDTRISGLNLDNIFLYLALTDHSENAEPYYGAVFLIDNLKTFENFLTKTKLMDDVENRLIRLPDGISTVQWNDEIAVISNAAGYGVDVFNKDESKSILANELFKADYSGKNDLYLYAECNLLLFNILNRIPYYSAAMDNAVLKNLEAYKDMSMSVSINSEKGEFAANAKLLPFEKATELFDKSYRTDFNSDLYRYISDKSLLAFKFAIKPLDIYSQYKKMIGLDQAGETAETTTEQVEILDDYGNVTDEEEVIVDKYSGYTSSYNLAQKMMIEQYDAQITSILENFTGDFIGSLSGITNIMTPDFAIAAGIVEGKENNITALIEQVGFVKNSDGYYSLEIQNMNFYFAVNKNAAYFTGTPEAIAKFFDKGYSSNITSAKNFGKELKDALAYFYWNININDYPALLKTFIAMSQNGNMVMPLLEKLKSISISSMNTDGGELKIKLNDSDYASKVILKEIDKLAAEYISDRIY